MRRGRTCATWRWHARPALLSARRRLCSPAQQRLAQLRSRVEHDDLALQDFIAPVGGRTAPTQTMPAASQLASLADSPEPQMGPTASFLTDRYRREHTYLRISLTERCSLRCVYCMPAEGVKLTASERLLQPHETLRIASLLVEAGVTKIRLTGGEPTVRTDLVEVVQGLSRLRPRGLQQIAMTTNGLALERSLPGLRAGGLDKLNVSLDTLQRDKFLRLTRRDGLTKVLRAIDSAIQHGYTPLKVNCVVMRGTNEDEVRDFARLAMERPIDVRFIEYMPFDDNGWSQKLMVPSSELLAQLQAELPGLERVQTDVHDVARTYRKPGGSGSVSFISSMTEPFCGGCNRIRLTADGNLKVCLFGASEVSLRDAIREGATDLELLGLVSAALHRKLPRHAGGRDARDRRDEESANDNNRRLMLLVGRPQGPLAPSSRSQRVSPTVITSPLARNLATPHSTLRQATRGAQTVASAEPPSTPKPPAPAQSVEEGSGKGTGAEEAVLTHIDATGKASMVDVGQKTPTSRTAVATATVLLGPAAFGALVAGENAKGDVLAVARVAGVMAAKRTADLIPLCHPLLLSHVSVDFELERERHILRIVASASCSGGTGVEMEAMTAAGISALTVYDMCKAASKGICISELRLLSKSGGKSGTWRADD